MLALIASLTLTFSTYGLFLSNEAHTAPAVDPQVFVKDGTAQAGIGPQNIAHDAGFRPAFVTTDPSSTPLFTAHGAPLGIALGTWLGATGTAEVVSLNPNAENVIVHLEGLSPYGAYSVFTNRLDQPPVVLSPLEGEGIGNSFVADAGGSATLTVLVTPALPAASAVVVVFHSDGTPHGTSSGAPGVTSHNQLIARLPK